MKPIHDIPSVPNYILRRIWQTIFQVEDLTCHLPAPELLVEEKQYRDYRISPRPHSVGSQLSITLSGEGRLKVGTYEHRLTPGKAFIHNHAEPGLSYFYAPGGTKPWRFIWMAFNNSEALVADFNRKYGFVFTLSENSGVLAGLKSYRSAGSVHFVTPWSGARMIFDLLCRLETELSSTAAPTSGSLLTRRIQELTITNPAASTEAWLAQKMGLSREHLSRVFHRETGVTLRAYRQNLRLTLAHELLGQTGLTLKEIAVRTGFASAATLSRALKLHR